MPRSYAPASPTVRAAVRGALAALLSLALLAHARPLDAQGEGQGDPNHSSVTVSRLGDLVFGLVVGGASVVVRPDDPAAAHFEVRVRGGPSHVVTLTIALPAALLSGPDRLPVRFDANSAAWATSDAPDARTAFDPARGTTVTLDQRGPKSLLVWIGGTLEPMQAQPSGDYSALIALSAVEN
ncbi:MAG TPA: DUF4402 domain-containing protein [Longimicrobiales bacterium]|nr:DUF4402 domain-containing protein [Longimicrobiales bacterium]